MEQRAYLTLLAHELTTWAKVNDGQSTKTTDNGGVCEKCGILLTGRVAGDFLRWGWWSTSVQISITSFHDVAVEPRRMTFPNCPIEKERNCGTTTRR